MVFGVFEGAFGSWHYCRQDYNEAQYSIRIKLACCNNLETKLHIVTLQKEMQELECEIESQPESVTI